MELFESFAIPEVRKARLSTLNKDCIVFMVKAIKGSAGDYARTDKAVYVDMLSTAPADAVYTAYRNWLELQSLRTPNPTPKETPIIAAAPESAAAQVSRISKLLAELLSNPSMDEDAVRRIVQEEVKGIKPSETFVTVTHTGEELARIETAHACLPRVLKLASIGTNIMLKGPAGSGKTHLASQVAQAMKRPFHMNSLTSGASETDLIGKLLPIGAGGKFMFVPGPFLTAFENGGVWLGDEFDAADENMVLCINSALANGHLSVPARPDAPVAVRHPEFVCIVATNTWGHGADSMYVGRNKLDDATLDRFASGIVSMDYDTALEDKLCDPAVLSWGRHIRAQIAAKKLRRIMSTRSMLAFSKQVRALGFTRQDWEEPYFASWTQEERSKVA